MRDTMRDTMSSARNKKWKTNLILKYFGIHSQTTTWIHPYTIEILHYGMHSIECESYQIKKSHNYRNDNKVEFLPNFLDNYFPNHVFKQDFLNKSLHNWRKFDIVSVFHRIGKKHP